MAYIAPGVYVKTRDFIIRTPRDLREAFLDIKRQFLLEQCSRHTLEEMTLCYNSLFRSYGLEDLCFRLEINDEHNGINFIPMRIIDKLAIDGIMAIPQLLTRRILFEKIEK